MTIIKLDAIDSTNDFLKHISQQNELENFTVVTAKKQTKGRGQMGTTWVSEKYKNLICSILLKKSITNIDFIFNLNIVIAVSIIEALKSIDISKLSVKWPNDIMSGDKKIAGILIENTIKESGVIDSIIGIGLNVNQTNFDLLPKASSLKNVMNQDFDIEKVLNLILTTIQNNINTFNTLGMDSFCEKYESLLFKKDKPTVFENASKEKFMGIIKGVSSNGMLKIMLDDDSLQYFSIKEVAMVY